MSGTYHFYNSKNQIDHPRQFRQNGSQSPGLPFSFWQFGHLDIRQSPLPVLSIIYRYIGYRCTEEAKDANYATYFYNVKIYFPVVERSRNIETAHFNR
jgi:hypothetical protein